MNAAQCRAARALLDWSQTHLAKHAGLGLSTVVDFEKERRAVSAEAVGKMTATLEAAGVEFTNGDQPGVRMVKVDWRDSRQGDKPAEGERVIVQYTIGLHQTQPATFNAEKREWHLDNGTIVPEREAGLWSPGPWPRT